MSCDGHLNPVFVRYLSKDYRFVRNDTKRDFVYNFIHQVIEIIGFDYRGIKDMVTKFP